MIRLLGKWLVQVAFLLLLPSLSAAQVRPDWPIAEGDFVRLYSPAGDTLRAEGLVERMDGDHLVLVLRGREQRFSRSIEPSDVFAIRRSVPPARSALNRSVWGAFLGASLGGISAPFVAGASDSSLSMGTSIGIGVGVAGLVGAGVGAALGYLLPQHRWERFRVQPDKGVFSGG